MINKRLFGTPISGSVRQKLEARQKVAGDLQFGQSKNGTQMIDGVFPDVDGKVQAYLSSRTPFVRMISNKKDVENIVISGCVRNPDGTMKHGFKKSGEGAYYNTKVEGETQSGIRPIAGIRDVEISYKGGFKAIRCNI